MAVILLFKKIQNDKFCMHFSAVSKHPDHLEGCFLVAHILPYNILGAKF